MNRNEFVAEVLAALGGRNSEDETVKLTAGGSSFYLVYEWIYRAERRIASRHDFDCMREEDTSLSTSEDSATPIALSGIDAYTKSIQSIRIIDGTSSYKIRYKPPRWMDTYYPNISAFSSGKPEFYTIKNKSIQFNCMPDDDYTLYIDRIKWPSKMSSGTSVSDFGEHFVDHVILEYAIGLGFNSMGEAYKKDADYHLRRGDEFLSEMIAADNYVPDYEVYQEGFRSSSKAPKHWALDAGSVPGGTVNPWR